MPRTVLLAPDFRRAIAALKVYSEPVKNPWPFGPEDLVYRVEKDPDGYWVRGYTGQELQELTRGESR